MKFHIFAVYDLKAYAFIPPFTMPTPEMATRTFSDGANDPTHMFCKHPTDFGLFHLGEFDDATGDIEVYSPNINLGLAANFKQSVN